MAAPMSAGLEQALERFAAILKERRSPSRQDNLSNWSPVRDNTTASPHSTPGSLEFHDSPPLFVVQPRSEGTAPSDTVRSRSEGTAPSDTVQTPAASPNLYTNLDYYKHLLLEEERPPAVVDHVAASPSTPSSSSRAPRGGSPSSTRGRTPTGRTAWRPAGSNTPTQREGSATRPCRTPRTIHKSEVGDIVSRLSTPHRLTRTQSTGAFSEMRDLRACTFTPELNQNSKAIAANVCKLSNRIETILKHKEDKQASLRTQRAQSEVQYRFRPNINPYSKSIERTLSDMEIWEREKRERMDKKRSDIEEEECSPCTFKPSITPMSAKLARRRLEQEYSITVSTRAKRIQQRDPLVVVHNYHALAERSEEPAKKSSRKGAGQEVRDTPRGITKADKIWWNEMVKAIEDY